jgi:photosystem II stability/assembly factor-like uncharacterized protein
MKNMASLYLFVTSAMICLAFKPSMAQGDSWERMNGPYGGSVSEMAVNSNGYIFAITWYGGLYRSTDNGDTWSENLAGNPVTNGTFFSLAANNSGHIFVCKQGSISRSTDNGETWTQISFEDPVNYFAGMAVNSSGQIFGGGLLGMFRSSDNGNTWVEINTGLNHSSYMVRCVTIDDSGHIFAGCDNGIYRSTDNGDHWTQINENLNGFGPIAVTKSGYILVAKDGSGLFRATADGQSWTQVYSGEHLSALAVDSKGQVFLGTLTEGILRSGNEGNTWQPVNQGIINNRIISLVVDQNDHVFAGSDGGGVYRSTNNGDEWIEVNSGFDNATVLCLTTNDSSYIFAGINGNGIHRATAYNSAWTKSSQGMTDPFVWALATNSNNVLFAATIYENYRSIDGGNNWIPMPDTPQFWTYTTTNNGDVYASGGGIFQSTDDGLNWNLVSSLSELGFCSVLSTNDSGHIFAGCRNGIYRSTDNGQNWIRFTVDPVDSFVFSIGIGTDGHIFAGVHDNGWVHCNVYKSVDNGEHWIQSNNGLQDRQALSFAVNTIGHLFVATNSDGVYRSIDDGETWEPFGLGQQCILCLLMDSKGYLYAGSGSGGISSSGNHLYRSKYSTVSNIKNSEMVSIDFKLRQNYPNPFNPSTTIEFDIPTSGYVSLKVYNVMGQEVAILLNKELPSGNHKVEWKPENLSSGIYFYKLETKGYQETKKLILMK